MPRRVSSSSEPDVLDEIDVFVRRAYEEILNEDLPNRLVRVLNDLRAREDDENRGDFEEGT